MLTVMKKHPIVRLILIYVVYVALFCIAKLAFMLIYFDIYRAYDFGQWIGVCLHGLPLDASTAGYLTILPGLLLCAEPWIAARTARYLWRGYFAGVGLLLAAVFTADAVLYGYWGFRLDSTPFIYLKNPALAIASAPWWQIAGGLAAVMILSIGIYALFTRIAITDEPVVKHRVRSSAAVFVLTALLIIPIRGGFSVSVMNVGKVYYSADMALNHAAVNPCFSLFESLSQDNDFGGKYRFMTNQRASEIFAQMTDKGDNPSSIPLLRTDRPNIILVVLESFSYECLANGSAAGLDSIARQGVRFTNFYANSFRTDRGLVSILSGYPSQPTASIMKYPHKSQSLPSIPRTLKKLGYDLKYYYGGDADFTNMRSYLHSSGIKNIVSQDDFPDTPKFKWGVHDGYLFERVIKDLESGSRTPFMYIIQTSSSHEPFEVPTGGKTFDDAFLNSVAYTDWCLSSFVNDLKKSEYWDNTLVVLVADHAMRWPQSRTNYDVERYHIPLVLTGGAINKKLEVDVVGSQMDIAATLLSQMGIDRRDFKFSKDMLNFSAPHFAYFSAPDLFGMVIRRGNVVYDCASGETARSNGDTTGLIDYGKALLQTLYDDIEAR